MKLILTIPERILIKTLLPTKGNLRQMQLSNKIEADTKLTDDEKIAVGYKETDQGVNIDTVKCFDTEIEVTAEELSILHSGCLSLDKNSIVDNQNLGLIEKINTLFT